jgi:hypothetical protein
MSKNRSNDDLEELGDLLGRISEPPIPAGLEAKLLAAIPDALPLASRNARRRSRGRRWLAGGLVAAAALLAVAIGWFFPRPIGRENLPVAQPAPQIAAHEQRVLGAARSIDGDIGSAPYSFQWPVQLTLSARAQRMPEDLTN